MSVAAESWNHDEQLSYLRGLTAGLEHDVRLALEPSFRVDWYIGEDGEWSYRCWGGSAWFGMPEPPSSPIDREYDILRIVEMIADNLWPDEWTDAWPRCLLHGDHPLSPAIEHERASWVGRRDHRVSTPIGELGDPFRALSEINPVLAERLTARLVDRLLAGAGLSSSHRAEAIAQTRFFVSRDDRDLSMTMDVELPLGSGMPGGFAWDGSVARAEEIADLAADRGIEDVRWDQENVGATGWEPEFDAT